MATPAAARSLRRALPGALLAVVLSAVSVAGTVLLLSRDGQAVYSLVLVAVAVAIWLAGLVPALLATALTALGTGLWVVRPEGSLAGGARDDLVRWLLFVLAALIITGLGHFMRTARVRAERSERRLALVAQVHAALEGAIDIDDRLRRLGEMLVPEIADCCVLRIHEGEEEQRVAAVLRAAPQDQELSARTGREPATVGRPVPAEGLLIPDVDVAGRQELGGLVPDWCRARLPGARALLAVPLSARGSALGSMVLVGCAPRRRFNQADLRLAMDVARRTALQLDNARLFGAERTARAALERSDALKTAMLRAVSHEMRTPLTAISAAAESLSQVEERAVRHELEEIVVSEVARLERVVANLLDLSRLEGGILRPRLDDCSVAEVIAGSRLAARSFLGADQLEVASDGEWPLVRVDPVLTERILVNLLQNAATHGAPPVRIEARRSGERVQVVVSDSGDGIDADLADRIFDGFVGDGRNGGLGLGLPLSRRLAEAQGGELHLVRRSGPTSFAVELPCAGGGRAA